MRIESQINVHDTDFLENKNSLLRQIEEFQSLENSVIEKSNHSSKEQKNNKLLPRERLALLLDPQSPFLELSSLAGYGLHDDKDGSLAGGGLIAGIGFIENTRCMIVVNVYTLKGGTISPSGLKKILRLQDISLQNRLPLVTLAESGGANLNYAAEVYTEGARAFANQAKLSAQGIPQVTVVHGNATAGGAYQPGLSDYIVLIESQSKMFLAGPPLVRAATGEIANDEELGGAPLHAERTGTGEFLVKDDAEAIGLTRKIIRSLDWNSPQLNPYPKASNDPKEPWYDIEELLGIVPRNSKRPYDVKEILARLLDESDFDEFKMDYDTQTICGRGRLFGRGCGFIGNNGPITAKGAGKAAQFIQLCEQSRTPIIFLHNTTGFMVGTEAEQSGIIRQGSKMIQAVANCQVPKISLLIGGSFGAGNYAMCGRGFDPHFIFSWPNSKTAVMGGEQAGKVLRIVAEEKMKRMKQPIDEAALSALESKTAEQLDRSSTALFATSQLWDDGIIDPRKTREILGFVLETCIEAELRRLSYLSFGVGRQ